MYDIYEQLEDYCRWGIEFNLEVGELLKKENIDISYDNYRYFLFAIRNDNLELLKMLIDYYEKHVLARFDEGTTHYNAAKARLYFILNEYVQNKTCQEIKEFIADYTSCFNKLDQPTNNSANSNKEDSDNDSRAGDFEHIRDLDEVDNKFAKSSIGALEDHQDPRAQEAASRIMKILGYDTTSDN
ncbi:MAG: hypothetical protein K0Q51_1105 [Rickettsiaceae bacterium]|jgi:hypothetical protein|nr:hypothetical protein [Rickettsiaceae bacterium]